VGIRRSDAPGGSVRGRRPNDRSPTRPSSRSGSSSDAKVAARLLKASTRFVPRFYELGWRAALRIPLAERE
jgi:hypothetical protein